MVAKATSSSNFYITLNTYLIMRLSTKLTPFATIYSITKPYLLLFHITTVD